MRRIRACAVRHSRQCGCVPLRRVRSRENAELSTACRPHEHQARLVTTAPSVTAGRDALREPEPNVSRLNGGTHTTFATRCQRVVNMAWRNRRRSVLRAGALRHRRFPESHASRGMPDTRDRTAAALGAQRFVRVLGRRDRHPGVRQPLTQAQRLIGRKVHGVNATGIRCGRKG